MSSKFKLRRLPLVQLAVYALARAATAVICMFPPRAAIGLGRLLGRALRLVHARRRLAAENIARAEGMPRDPREIERIVRGMYEHIGLMLVENLLIPRMVRRGEFLGRSRLENFEVIERALARGRGAIFVLGHQMNWEWGGVALTLSGWPLNSVARPIENPWLDEFLNRFRTQAGQKIISKYEPVRAMAEVLRRNEILVLLADQDAHSDGAFVPFFGRPASTVKGPALLAIRHRAPIVPVEIWRDGADVHHVRLAEAIEPEAFGVGRGAVARLTAAYTAVIERFVRAHPDQWTWLHARWKSTPRPDGSPDPRCTELAASE